MSALEVPQRYYTPEEYLALEREADFKSEYFEGRIYAMAGAGDPHNVIADNIVGELYIQMKGSPCRSRSRDTKVRSSDGTHFFYPDIVVVCGQPQYHDGTKDVLVNPKIIVEVLSPSTEAVDRGEKFEKLKSLASLTDYILVAQGEPQIDHFIRQSDGSWSRQSASGLDAEIYIASIGCTLRLIDVYGGIPLPLQLQLEIESNQTQE